MAARRKDFGKPIESFLAKQPQPLRAIVDALRALIEETAPDATTSLKWGMPHWSLGGKMLCAVGAHKAHVNLILPGAYDDPEGLLEGEGKTGKHLRIESIDDLPEKQVRAWLKTAATRAAG